MTQTERKLVEKLEELIKLYERIFQTDTLSLPKCDKIISEIASLKQQMAEEVITDADIEAWADREVLSLKGDPYIRKRYKGLIDGAKAMRDGEIKHIKNQ